MVDTKIIYRDGALNPRDRRIFTDALGDVPVNAEHPEQRAALLGALKRGYGSLDELLAREGDLWSPLVTPATYTTFTGNQGGGPGVPVPPPGRATFLRSIDAWATTPVDIRMQLITQTGVTGAGFQLAEYNLVPGPAKNHQVPVNAFLRSSDRYSGNTIMRTWLDPSVTGTHRVGITYSAVTLADSINFDARKVQLMLGDSTWNGTGPTTVDTAIPYQINKFHRDAGDDTRYILKAYSGSTSVGIDAYRANGKFDFPQVDAIHFNLGINDAIQNIGTAVHEARVQATIAWKQRRYPDAKLVIYGTTPVQDATVEGRLAAMRAAAQARVTAAADPRVLFCDLNASFNRTVGTNYITSDGADGTRIHPSDAALVQVLDGGYNGYAGLRAWLSANLPRL